VSVDLLAAPGTYPVPQGRGRYRVTLHNRAFTSMPPTWDRTIVAELVSAQGRRLTQVANTAAQFDFSLDGRSPECVTLAELGQDVYVWRWDDTTGADVCVFRGVVDHSQDTVTEDGHTVAVTAHDYLGVLARRFIRPATQQVFVNADQDTLAASILNYGNGGANTDLDPGSWIPLQTSPVNPDGSPRGLSGQLLTRTYQGGQPLGTALSDLSLLAPPNGFDYDVQPGAVAGLGRDALRVFYPNQGVARTDVVLEYGANVANLQRTVDSTAYSNYVRVLGNNNSSDPTVAQVIAEASNADAANPTVGLWPLSDNASSVSVPATLAQHAAGDLNEYGTLTPTYVLGLTPGWYVWGYPRMGDTVQLIVRSGRLNVNTSVRVVGVTFDVGDDGQEDVTLTVGRPLTTLAKLLHDTTTDIGDLVRR